MRYRSQELEITGGTICTIYSFYYTPQIRRRASHQTDTSIHRQQSCVCRAIEHTYVINNATGADGSTQQEILVEHNNNHRHLLHPTVVFYLCVCYILHCLTSLQVPVKYAIFCILASGFSIYPPPVFNQPFNFIQSTKCSLVRLRCTAFVSEVK